LGRRRTTFVTAGDTLHQHLAPTILVHGDVQAPEPVGYRKQHVVRSIMTRGSLQLTALEPTACRGREPLIRAPRRPSTKRLLDNSYAMSDTHTNLQRAERHEMSQHRLNHTTSPSERS
jgi:hypothetical protein